MTPSPNTLLQTITVTTADDLVTLWGALMGGGGFGRRTLWLVVLEDDGRPTPMIVPIDDIPRAPTQRDVDGLSTILAGIAEFGSVVWLLSRPGVDVVQEDDRRWARALTPLASAWPVHLATRGVDGQGKVQPITG